MSDLSLFLASFVVSVPTPWPTDPVDLFPIRQAVTEGLDAAGQELVNTRVLEARVESRATVAAIQPGSVELLVLVHGLLQLPHMVSGLMSDPAVHQAFDILKGIGTAVGAVKSLSDGGRWILGNLHQKRESVATEPTIAQLSSLDVQPVQGEALGEPPRPLAAKDLDIRSADAWVDDQVPRAVAVVLDHQTGTVVRQILRIPPNNDMHLGGPTVIRDGNLLRNGLRSVDDLRDGGVFVLHNAAALGLQPVGADSLYAACADPSTGVRIVDARLDTIDIPDAEPHRVTGGAIDINDPRVH